MLSPFWEARNGSFRGKWPRRRRFQIQKSASVYGCLFVLSFVDAIADCPKNKACCGGSDVILAWSSSNWRLHWKSPLLGRVGSCDTPVWSIWQKLFPHLVLLFRVHRTASYKSWTNGGAYWFEGNPSSELIDPAQNMLMHSFADCIQQHAEDSPRSCLDARDGFALQWMTHVLHQYHLWPSLPCTTLSAQFRFRTAKWLLTPSRAKTYNLHFRNCGGEVFGIEQPLKRLLSSLSSNQLPAMPLPFPSWFVKSYYPVFWRSVLWYKCNKNQE